MLQLGQPYIYRIYRTNTRGGGGYIGQSKGTGEVLYGRIFQHIKTAYGLENTSKSGGSELIKTGGASELFYKIYTANDDCFGCGEDNYLEFSKTGTSSDTEENKRLSFAEMIGICAGMVTGDSEYNTGIGDKSFFTCDLEDGLQTILQNIYSTNDGQKIMSGTGVKLGVIRMHAPDSKDNIEKLLNPEYYAILRAFSYALTYRLFRGDQGEKWLMDNIINATINSQEDITKNLRDYITTEKKKEVYLGNKYLPSNYQINSANIRFDFDQDIKRIANFIGERIGKATYDIAEDISQKLNVILKSIKSSNGKITFKKHQMSQAAKETLRIKRNAYVDNIKINTKLPDGYINAQKQALSYKGGEILNANENFVNEIKQISYNGLVSIALKEMQNCPIKEPLFLTITGRDDGTGALTRNQYHFGDELRDYDREDTLMSRTRQAFFKDRTMHILNQNGPTYYRQCISIYMNNIGKPLQEVDSILNLEARSEKETPSMIEVLNSYGSRYVFKPYTGAGIQTNYTQTTKDLKYY